MKPNDSKGESAEPERKTVPALAGVLAALQAREPIFHRAAFGTCRADFDRRMAPEFWEVGASGQRYGRKFVLDLVEDRLRNPREDDLRATDFCCQELAPSLYLLTYTLVQDAMRVTRRSTIWRLVEGDWQVVFHQGTIVATG